MLAIFTTAFSRLFAWLAGAGTMKWLVGSVVFFGLAFLLEVVLDLLPAWLDAAALSAGFSVLTPEMWYFIDYFRVIEGLSLLLSAYALRFLIRRIPFIG